MSPKRRALAIVAAGLTFPASFCLLVEATAVLLADLYGWGHPNDGSTGDSAGWTLLLLSPILVPIFVAIAAGLAIAAYALVSKKAPID